MQYALWQDDVTWDSWVSWAKQNGYVADAATTYRTDDYSSWAISIKGNWSTIGENNFSFMCIGDATSASPKGAVCVEALLTGGAPPTTFASRTWRIPESDVAAKLDTPLASVATTLTDYGFTATYSLTETAESTAGNWASFQVMNCDVTTISMTCTNWAISSAGVTEYASIGGYGLWSASSAKAKFYWFDGLDLSDTATYPVDQFEKYAISAVMELEVTYGSAATLSVSVISAVAALLFAF